MIGHVGWKGPVSTNLSSVERDLSFTRLNPDLVALAVTVTEGTDKVDITPLPRLMGPGQWQQRARGGSKSSEQLSRAIDFQASGKACKGEPATSVCSRGAVNALGAPGWP